MAVIVKRTVVGASIFSKLLLRLETENKEQLQAYVVMTWLWDVTQYSRVKRCSALQIAFTLLFFNFSNLLKFSLQIIFWTEEFNFCLTFIKNYANVCSESLQTFESWYSRHCYHKQQPMCQKDYYFLWFTNFLHTTELWLKWTSLFVCFWCITRDAEEYHKCHKNT